MSLQTFRERWTLFVGTLMCVTLGVALVTMSVLVLEAAARLAADPRHEEVAGDMQNFMALIIMVAVFLTVFIIGSTFSFAVDERRRDLALLRLSGATRRQLRSLLVGEGLVVGVLGAAAGTVLGMCLVPVQLALVRRVRLPADLLDVQLSPIAGTVGVVGGLAVSVLGVWTAALRASRARPLDGLRDLHDAARVMTRARWAMGIVATIVTVATLAAARGSSDPLRGIFSAFVLVFSATVALQQLSPLLAPLVARLGTTLARKGAEGQVAHANLVDGRRRAATTAGPLIALVGIVIGVYGVVLTYSSAHVRDLEITTQADLVVMLDGPDVSGIAAVDGVAAVAPLAQVPGEFLLPGGEVRSVDLVATDPAAYRVVMTPRLREGSATAFDGVAAIANGDSDSPVPPGLTELRVRTGTREVTLGVTARAATSFADYSAAIIPLGQVDPAVLAGAPTRAMVTVSADADPGAVRASLAAAGYAATTTAAWAAGDQNAVTQQNRSLTLGLAGLGGLYALISVCNAVALAAAARKREFAVARVSGMTRGQVVRTAVAEALGVGLIGLGLGCVVAFTCLLAVYRGFALLLGENVLVVPWVALASLTLLSLTVVGVTAAVATALATRLQPITLTAARE